MKVSMNNVSTVVKNTALLSDLKSKMLVSTVLGDYRGYKTASKEFASIAVKDFQAAKNAPSPSVKNVPLFSKVGLKMAKVWFLNLFRIKTPEEKLLRKMAEEEKAKAFIQLHNK